MLRLFWSHLEPITGTANLETLQTPFVCSCQKAKTESTLWLIGGPTASLKSLNPFLFLIFLLLLTSSFTLILKLLLKGPVSLSNVKIKKKTTNSILEICQELSVLFFAKHIEAWVYICNIFNISWWISAQNSATRIHHKANIYFAFVKNLCCFQLATDRGGLLSAL